VSNKSTLYQPIQSQSYNPNSTAAGPQSNTNIASSNNYNNNNTNTLRGIQSSSQHQQHHHSMMNESTINTVAPNTKIGSNNANYSTLRGVPQQQIQSMLQENVVSNAIPGGTSYSNNPVNNANYNSIRTSVTSDNHLNIQSNSINYNNVNLRAGGGINQQGPGTFQDNIGSNINSGAIQSNMSTNSANYTMRGVPQQSMNMMNNDSVVNNTNNTIRTSVTQQQLATISQHDQLHSSGGNSNTGITQANITSNNANSKSEWEQYFATSQSLNISGNISFVSSIYLSINLFI
jgi:hypothetical protein